MGHNCQVLAGDGAFPRPDFWSLTPELKGHSPLPSSMAERDRTQPESRQFSVPMELVESKGNEASKQPGCLPGTAKQHLLL